MAHPRPQKSTIVRATQAAGLAGVRAGFGLLERVAPSAGARWAARLWCTPPRVPRRVRRRRAAPPGERFTVYSGDTGVAAEAWGSGPVVYLLPGWGGWRAQLDPFVEPLVATGHRVVALDPPGHGDSGPSRLGRRRATLTEAAEALVAVAAVAGPPRAVIAHSGGCVAAALAVREGLRVGRLGFIAPMSDPSVHFPDFARHLRIGERTMAAFVPTLEQLVGRAMPEFNVAARAAGRDDLPALLVVHDRGDRAAPYAGAETITWAWAGSRLVTTEGLGHRRILADPQVVTTVVDFAAARRLPAGPAMPSPTAAG